MNKKEDSSKVSDRLNRQIRPTKHGVGYYLSLFLLFFAIPLYILMQFFYGWGFDDLIFILILLTFPISGLYKEFVSNTKLPIWFIVLGLSAGIGLTVLSVIINALVR